MWRDHVSREHSTAAVGFHFGGRSHKRNYCFMLTSLVLGGLHQGSGVALPTGGRVDPAIGNEELAGTRYVSGSTFARSLRFTAASLSRLHLRIWYIIRTWYHTYVVVLCTVLASEKKATRCPRALPQQHSNLGFHKETGSRSEAAAWGLLPQACSWASRGTSDGLALGRWGRSSVWCSCSS